MTTKKGFLQQSGADWLSVVISRQEIESGNIGDTLNTLRSLFETPDTVRFFCGRVDLSIDGYNEDSRELFEIQEVRTFLQKLDKEFPFWFYFITKIDGGNCLGFISRCLCKWKVFSKGFGEYDQIDLERFLTEHLDAMNQIFDKFGLDEADNERLTIENLKCLGLKV